jgi:hypothetical protein
VGLAATAATGCRTVTPEARYHVHAIFIDKITRGPLAETRVAISLARVTDPAALNDEKVVAGRTDAGGSVTLVLRQPGGEVQIGMWSEYTPPEPPVLDKLYLYVWRGARLQRFLLELDPTVQAKAMPGHRWIEINAFAIPAAPTGKPVPLPYGPPEMDVPAPPVKDVPVPSAKTGFVTPIVPTPAPTDLPPPPDFSIPK